MPGLVDTHVHINEPGRADWEGFQTATRAAAAGGVTTLIDMPLNSIPATTTAAALEKKRAAARGKCWVNVGFWGGVVPGNMGELSALDRAGVFGFKCFLVPSGVPEFANVNEADLREALPALAAMNSPLLVHAELPAAIEAAGEKLRKSSPKKYETWLRSRPAAAETKAIEMLIRSRANSNRTFTSSMFPRSFRFPRFCARKAKACPSPPKPARIICSLRRARSEKAGRNSNAPRPFATRKITGNSGMRWAGGPSISSSPITRHRRRP